MRGAGPQFTARQEKAAKNIKGVPFLMQGENALVIIQSSKCFISVGLNISEEFIPELSGLN